MTIRRLRLGAKGRGPSLEEYIGKGICAAIDCGTMLIESQI